MFGTWHIILPWTRDVAAAEGVHVSGDQRAAAAVLLLSPDCTLTHVSTSHCLVRDGELKYSNQLCSQRRMLTIEYSWSQTRTCPSSVLSAQELAAWPWHTSSRTADCSPLLATGVKVM